MRKRKFSEEQVAMALRQGEAGTPVADICRKLGIGQATFFRWKKTCGSLGVPELRDSYAMRTVGSSSWWRSPVATTRILTSTGPQAVEITDPRTSAFQSSRVNTTLATCSG